MVVSRERIVVLGEAMGGAESCCMSGRPMRGESVRPETVPRERSSENATVEASARGPAPGSGYSWNRRIWPAANELYLTPSERVKAQIVPNIAGCRSCVVSSELL